MWNLHLNDVESETNRGHDLSPGILRQCQEVRLLNQGAVYVNNNVPVQDIEAYKRMNLHLHDSRWR